MSFILGIINRKLNTYVRLKLQSFKLFIKASARPALKELKSH